MLCSDAREIWQAGVDAVLPHHLIQRVVRCDGGFLHFGDLSVDPASFRRLVVVGAGKAAGSMAAAIDQILAPCIQHNRITGLVNVPDGETAKSEHIQLQPCRPVGRNLPTQRGVAATQRIVELVSTLAPNDLCIVLISGGGSALLPLPRDPVSLEDKIQVIEFLSQSAATIEQINTVRRQLSLVKGGRLAAACTAKRMIVLILSDILGDPLELIASGPTFPSATTNEQALQILNKMDPQHKWIPATVWQLLQREDPPVAATTARVDHLVIGNNQTAVDAAAEKARKLGYRTSSQSLICEGTAEKSGREIAQKLCEAVAGSDRWCLVSGGEPVVHLVESSVRGIGGRNQQLVLAALQMLQSSFQDTNGKIDDSCILSGGTDGEDGPTSAAGAWADRRVLRTVRLLKLDPGEYLTRNDAFHFFEQTKSLLKTGPTGTNVCDLRVALASPTRAG